MGPQSWVNNKKVLNVINDSNNNNNNNNDNNNNNNNNNSSDPENVMQSKYYDIDE